jgi:hypothetical protein
MDGQNNAQPAYAPQLLTHLHEEARSMPFDIPFYSSHPMFHLPIC